jgi:hypothetical protein
MKLFRGINADEFSHFTPEVAGRLLSTWEKILNRRDRGDFKYPAAINSEILEASKVIRLQRQHFTDNEIVAREYARKNSGLLVELDVPVSDVLKHFEIEFQNFSQRKKNFEIVYVVNATELFTHAKKWKMKTRKPELKT